MPEFEYYEFTNWVTREYFIWMVFVSQFLSWFSGSACFTITHYKWWNLLMFFMFGICLPVDILIFYAEPFGTFGTLGTTILAFAPFLSMVADSTFPEKKIWVKGKCKLLLQCYNNTNISLCFIFQLEKFIKSSKILGLNIFLFHSMRNMNLVCRPFYKSFLAYTGPLYCRHRPLKRAPIEANKSVHPSA